MFQAQNRETINSTLKVSVSFKIFVMSVTRPCFTTQHQTSKTVCKLDQHRFLTLCRTGLALRSTVSDHITGVWHTLPLSLPSADAEFFFAGIDRPRGEGAMAGSPLPASGSSRRKLCTEVTKDVCWRCTAVLWLDWAPGPGPETSWIVARPVRADAAPRCRTAAVCAIRDSSCSATCHQTTHNHRREMLTRDKSRSGLWVSDVDAASFGHQENWSVSLTVPETTTLCQLAGPHY